MLFHIQQILTVYILKCPADVKTVTCKCKILLKSGIVGAKGIRKMIVNKSMVSKYGSICVHIYWNDSVSGKRLSGWSTDKVKGERLEEQTVFDYIVTTT